MSEKTGPAPRFMPRWKSESEYKFDLKFETKHKCCFIRVTNYMAVLRFIILKKLVVTYVYRKGKAGLKLTIQKY
jgi:hypothetical protein